MTARGGADAGAESAQRADRGGAGAARRGEDYLHFPLSDLFGWCAPPPRPPGRPRHEPTPAQRAKVARMHQAGAKQPAIARALRVSLPTLRLCYASELESASQTGARRVARDQESVR